MPDAYHHEALAYRGHDEFVSSCVAVAREGFGRDEHAMCLAADAKLDDVRSALGPDAGRVTFVPTDEHGRNPTRVTTLLDRFQATANGRRCVGISESVHVGRSDDAMQEAQFTESVLNDADLSAWPLSLVCMYDADALDDASLHEMRRTHPVIRGEADNSAYEPDRARLLFEAPLPEPPERADAREVGAGDLADMRAFVRADADVQQLRPDRLDDLVLAANEIVTNSLLHGGGRCRLSLWRTGPSVVCEVRDAGRMTTPLLGRLPPPAEAGTGRGLWLANHLCDLVRIRSSQAGTVVRLHVDL